MRSTAVNSILVAEPVTASAVVTIGARRTIDYVLAALSLANRGEREVRLVAVGDCISKAAEVAHILVKSFGGELGRSDIAERRRNDRSFTSSSMCIRFADASGSKAEGPVKVRPEPQFVAYPFYQLLLDHLLHEAGEIILGTEEFPRCLTVRPTRSSFECSPGPGLRAAADDRPAVDGHRGRKKILDHLTEALYRAGVLRSSKWEEVALRLGQTDDIVLGLDTNVLYDCVVTQQLLDAFAFVCQGDQSPNWILLVVPTTVMHELEQAANSRNEKGQLTDAGRMGYRALQEILELDQSSDIRGVSLLIVGESNPVLDAREELRGLRDDLKRTIAPELRSGFSRKNSSGDTLIRDQFKAFLRQLSFHKGTCFLTADKSNCALGQAEGLHSLYYPKPPNPAKLLSIDKISLPPVRYEEEEYELTMPVGKLVYELAVEFGSVYVTFQGGQMHWDCDLRGDSLEHWVYRELRIQPNDLARLLGRYETSGHISLANLDHVWSGLKRNMAGW